ncbi:acyltransferase family protein [Burkholderia glumae]
MNIYSTWHYFVTIAMILTIMALPLFAHVDEPANPAVTRRVESLDGLRGILALSVAVHHLVTACKFHFDGVWGWLPSGFYNQLGEASVALFFMVTGYLFWRRLVLDDGRTNLPRLYVGRLFRIAPMYLFVVVCMFAIVAHRTGYTLHVSLRELAVSVARWLSLGIGGAQIPLNGDEHANLVLAGVTWTIGYEWAFYASLIALCLVARRRIHLIVAIAAILASASLTQPGLGLPGFCLLFASGMLAASLGISGFSARGPLAAVAAIAALALAVHESPSTYGHLPQVAGLTIFFVVVASGNSLFGMLHTRAAERLGNISYSVYLSQGLVITGFYALPFVKSWAYLSPELFWLSALCCCAVLVSLASVTYCLIERPMIRIGRSVQNRIRTFAPIQSRG